MQKRPLWLASYSNGRVVVGDGTQGRRSLRLPRPPWFTQQLQEHDLLHTLEIAMNFREPLMISALLLVTPGQFHKGPLTRWDRTCSLQRWYYEHPLDAYSVEIIDVAACHPPIQSLHRRTHNAASSMGTTFVSAHRGVYYPYWLSEDEAAAILVDLDGVRRSAREALEQWQLEDIDFDSIPCVQAPAPVCELILRKAWHRLLCLGRWEISLRRAGLPRPFEDWPGPTWIASVAGKSEAFARCALPTVDGLAEVEDLLRQVGEKVGQALPQVGRDACVECLEIALGRLAIWRLTAAEAGGQHTMRLVDGSAHVRHSSFKLVESLRLCRALKGGWKATGLRS